MTDHGAEQGSRVERLRRFCLGDVPGTVLAMGLAMMLLSLNQYLLFPAYSTSDGCYFGADTGEIVGAFVSKGKWYFDYWKRPAFGPSVYSVFSALSVVGAPDRAAFSIAMAFPCSVASGILWAMVRASGGSRLVAAATSLLYIGAFANLAVFSIAESYGWTSLALVVVGMVVREALAAELSIGAAFAAGAVIGAAAWFNAPLLAGACVLGMALFERSVGSWLARGGSVLGTACVAWGTPLGLSTLVLSSTTHAEYANKWASTGNFFDPLSLKNVFLAFVPVGVVSPMGRPPGQREWLEAGAYLAEPVAATLLVGLMVMAAVILVKSSMITSSHWRWVWAMAVWCGMLWVFYIFFNPAEAFLYASQPVTLCVMTLGLLAANLSRQSKLSRATEVVLLVLVLSVLGWNEWSVVLGEPVGECVK